MNQVVQSENETLLTFPCAYPFKIMGKNQPELLEQIKVLFEKHVPTFDANMITTRASKAGNYLSITCTIQAQSKNQLDALYLDLTANPLILMVL